MLKPKSQTPLKRKSIRLLSSIPAFLIAFSMVFAMPVDNSPYIEIGESRVPLAQNITLNAAGADDSFILSEVEETSSTHEVNYDLSEEEVEYENEAEAAGEAINFSLIQPSSATLIQVPGPNWAVANNALASSNPGDEFIFELTGNITAGQLTVPAGRKVTVMGIHDAIGPNWGSAIIVDGELTLNVSRAGGVQVRNNGMVTLESGVISGLIGGTNHRGVTVQGNGTFIMESGAIEGFNGSAVFVEGNGTFIMNGGYIRNNFLTNVNSWGGGVHVRHNGTFIMEDGVITGNESPNHGGGVALDETALFEMHGGTISGNTSAARGGGVFVTGSATFHMFSGVIENNSGTHGGGVRTERVQSTFIMEDGIIRGNSAAHGGGVYTMGIFNMTDGMITNNTARRGGGVLAGGGIHGMGTFDMQGGSITGNTATEEGGGVAAWTNNFTVADGIIRNNNAVSGGGIWISESNASISLGSEISGNTATGTGGGIAIQNINSSLTVSGAEISGNTAINGGGIGFLIYKPNPVEGDFEPWLDIITINSDAHFNSNTAPLRVNAHLALHSAGNIQPGTVTVTSTGHSLTNIDIHTPPSPVTLFVEGHYLSGVTGAGDHLPGTVVFANRTEARANHTFSGWTFVNAESGAAITPAGLQAETVTNGVAAVRFTMPNHNLRAIANWTSTGGNGSDNGNGNNGNGDNGNGDNGNENTIINNNPDVPPIVEEGNTLILGEDGSWIELDEFGVPLGEWVWDDDEEIWIFEAFPPLAAFEMPKTGETPLAHVLFVFGIIMAGAGAWFMRYKRFEV